MAMALDPLIPSPPSATTNFSSLAAKYGGSMPSAGSGVSGSAVEPDQPYVYMGLKDVPAPMIGTSDWTPREWEQNATTTQVGKSATLTKALRKFDKMTIVEQKKMLRLLAIAGFAGAIDLADIDEAVAESSQLDARDAYKNLLSTAAEYYTMQGLRVTPDDVLRSHIAYRLQGSGVNWNGNFNVFDKGIAKAFKEMDADLEGASELGPSIPKEFTDVRTDTAVDYMNPADAKALTRSMLQQELGRDPTQGEYEDFLSAIMAAERENPTTQTTTTKYELDPNNQLGIASQRTVQHGGMTSAGYDQLLREQAQSQPGWAEWQAMGTYAPALFAALGSTVPGT